MVKINKKKKLGIKKRIPGIDELEAESNLLNRDIEEDEEQDQRVEYPEIEDELGMSKIEAEIARESGYFSDQVLLGSPAAEAGESGDSDLKSIIEKSNKKLSQKTPEPEGNE